MKIELTYNPYTKDKQLVVDGKVQTLDNCWTEKEELSSWVDKFFEAIYSKFHRDSIDFSFIGIERDYEYITDALNKFLSANPNKNYSLIDSKISNPNESFTVMKDVFAEIQSSNNPFNQLKTDEIKNQYESAISNEFEMAVVATVSSGKSTLINSILGRSLMPSANEPLTAKVVRIHDIDGQDSFRGETFDINNNQINTIQDLQLSDMRKINMDSNINSVEIYGDIAGVKSDNLHLVLIDTPGTNNSETESHQNTTYSLIDSNDAVKPVILYILNSEQLRTNDDKKLLNDMANVMSEGGRADSERFIFILNKADAFNPDDNEDLQSVLDRCTKYLEECGIKNPRIFPCSAQFALVIRKKMAGYELTDDEDDDFEKALKTVTKNRIPKMFSQWAPLRKELKNQMEVELNLAKQKNDIENQALIYSGVPAIELAINDYLLKYAMPIKIRDGVTSFNETLKNLALEQKEKEKLLQNEAERKKRIEEIEKIESVLNDGRKALDLEQEIDKLSVQEEILGALESYGEKNSEIIGRYLNDKNSTQVKKSEADNKCRNLISELNNANSKFKADIVNVFDSVFKQQIEFYVETYNSYVKQLIRDNTTYDNIDPAVIFGTLGSLNVDSSLHKYTESRNEQIGTKKLEETGIKGSVKRFFGEIFKQDWGYYYKPVFGNVEYVNLSEYIEKQVSKDVENSEKEARELALNRAYEEQCRLKVFFKQQIQKLNKEMHKKIEEQKNTLKVKENFESEILKNKTNIEWLQRIDEQMNLLLKI